MNKVHASALIKNEKGEYLAVHINKELGGWFPPGGKLEDNESPRVTAIRETKEELGVDIKITKLVGYSEFNYSDDPEDPSDFWIFLYYEAEIISGEPEIMELGKLLEWKFLPIEKLNSYPHINWL